ncbi:MAG: polysaccharide deacetylase family protein [Candidatus Omnitrophota bacterium]|jgi:peptidoglycan/xylan/chitin deacetylase (PgdA/CDA1 family)
MKIIISHDVDWITAWEHKTDFRIPSFIVRGLTEFALGHASLLEFMGRIQSIFRNSWQNINKLMEFDKAKGVPATFFVAVSQGRGLSYSLDNAKAWINAIQENGFDVGLHGIAFEDYSEIQREREIFKEISKTEKFGIRVHGVGVGKASLKLTRDNLELFDQAGYLFSSNTFTVVSPYKAGGIWEFPVHMMDSDLLCQNKKYQCVTYEGAKERTQRLFDESRKKGVKYFSLLFHDTRFNDNFMVAKKWYIWFVEHCIENKLPFISYRDAVRELEAFHHD